MITATDSVSQDSHVRSEIRALRGMFDVVNAGLLRVREQGESLGFSKHLVSRAMFTIAEDFASPYHTCPKSPIVASVALFGAYNALRLANPPVPEEEVYPALMRVMDRVLDCDPCRAAFLRRLQAPSVESVVRNSLLLEAIRKSSQ